MSARSTRSVKTDAFRRLTSAQLEEQLVRKRQAEFERLNFWNNNSTYFKAWNFNTTQYSNWASNEFYNSRAEHLKKIETKRKKQEILVERRNKLKQLLGKEEKDYEIELKNLSKRDNLSLEDLKLANIELLLREEENRRRERDLKLYHHWRQSQPILREFESKQHYDFVKKAWVQQVLEKKSEREMEERKVLEHIENLKQLDEEHRKIEKEILEERKRTEDELKIFLEKQIEIVKCKEEQENILKRKELSVLKAQADLDELLDQRKKIEEKRKRKDLSLFHKRQYQLLIKRRAQEVKDNLEKDRQFLERLAKEEEFILKEKNERMERFKRELELAREAFRKQAEVENIKLNQCQFLFEEEARKMWEKNEAEWNLEEEARNKLIGEVLKMIKIQIQDKLLENLKSQEELKKCREEMMKKIEEANKELKDYEEKSKLSMENWKKDLEHQILEKKLQIFQQKKKQEEDKENELKAKREEQEMLFKELSKMNILGYQPKVNRRRRLLPL